MRAPRVLVLEVAGPESGAIARAGAARGYQMYAVTDSAETSPVGGLRDVLSGQLLTAFADAERSLDDVVGYGRRIGADAIITANEYLTPLLAHACAALGLPGNDPARALAARNKAVMHEAFTHHGVATPRTRILRHPGELRSGTADLGFPCVIKPADGAGSAGVAVVTDLDEAAHAWLVAQEPRGMYGMPLDPRILVQDYAEGSEYSVESITQHGKTTHLCLTRKTVTSGAHRVEIGHSLPAALPAHLEQAVQREVERAITAAGIRQGASHTEVILDAHGRCSVIEIAARLGAGHIGVLIQYALGIDPWTAILDTALGRPAQLTPTRAAYASVRFLTSLHSGRLADVTGLPRVSATVPVVHLRTAIGAVVGPAHANRARLGHLILTGPDATAVEEQAERLLDQITIDVTAETGL